MNEGILILYNERVLKVSRGGGTTWISDEEQVDFCWTIPTDLRGARGLFAERSPQFLPSFWLLQKLKSAFYATHSFEVIRNYNKT